VTGDSKVSIFDLDAIKTTIMLKPTLILDATPIKTIFAHNKTIVEAKIPRDNDHILITLAKDNTLVVWDIASGTVIKKFVFDQIVTCFDCVSFPSIFQN
jgi:WD40 repeat protein